MSHPESLGSTPGRSPEKAGREDYGREYFDAALDMIDKVGDFAAALRSDRMPDLSQYSFMFDGQKVDGAYLPESVREVGMFYGQLDEIIIGIEHDEGAPSSSLSYSFHFIDNDGNLTLFKVERPGHYSDNPARPFDHLYEINNNSKYRQMRPVPSHELSRLVASLLFPPNPTGDFTAFDQLNLNDGTIYESLVSAMQKHSSHYTGQEFFELSKTDRLRPGSFSYTVDNGTLISAEVQQMKSSDIVMHDGTIVSVSKAIMTEIDLSDGVTLAFSYANEHGSEFEREPFAPDLADYEIANEFIEHHTFRANPIQTERLNELTLPTTHHLPSAED